MSRCSVPKFIGIKAWWDKHLGDLCDEHDAIYKERKLRRKFYSDMKFAYFIAERGHVWKGLAALLFCLTGGTLFWLWKYVSEPVGRWLGKRGTELNK